MRIAVLALMLAASSVLADNKPIQQVHALMKTYEADLFPFVDPFIEAYNLESGHRIFKDLKKARGENTPLALVSDALIHFHAQSQELDTALVSHVLDDAQKVISSSGYKHIEKQSNWLALAYLRDYLARFELPTQTVDRDGKPAEDENTKQEEQEQQKQPPQHPELPEDYKPSTKETGDKQPGKKEDQVILAEANFATPYFGQRSYAEVVRHAAHPFKSIDWLIALPKPSKYQLTGKTLIIHTLGQTSIKLFIPAGFEPLQPEDTRAEITRDAKGLYILTTTKPLDSISIPVREVQSSTLSPMVREIYIRPVGFSKSEFPALIRNELLNKEFGSDLQTAKAIQNHIALKYLYSVGPKPETDPVDALNSGAFQCDMAAYLMVGILRDVYQIPARPVSGFRGKKHGSGKDQKSYLVQPGDAHAWVEAYIDGKWQVFDPTPVKKDKKEDKKGEGEKDEFSDRSLDDQPQSDEPPEQDKQDGAGNETDSNSTDSNSTDSNSTNSADPQMDSEELANQLTLGSLELDPSEDRSPLRERFIRVLAKLILDPTLDGNTIFEKLDQAKQFLSSNAELRSLIQEQLVIHEKRHPPLKVWLDEIIAQLQTRDLAKTYNDLYRLTEALKGYGQLLDGPAPSELIASLTAAQREIYGLAPLDSQDIAMVAEFYNSLPWIIHTLLSQKHNLNQVGLNQPTREVARLLKSGSMNDLKLLSLLMPLTDFVLNSTPRPEYEEVMTWQRDSNKPVGRELLPVQKPVDLLRAALGQPGKSHEQNWREGTAYSQVHRQRLQVPTGFGKDDAERITVVLYDVSGSMSGDPLKFQAGLISAFTARAISDLSPSGAHRHQVVLVPFHHEVGEPKKVTNTAEALEILNDYQRKLDHDSGGTDIQKALIQAMALIADAERRSGEPLAAANIVLMTDGMSDLDIPALSEARNAIDRSTPLQIMFVAIGSTNDELIKFVQESQKVGIEQGFYRHFDHNKMSELLRKAEAPLAGSKPGEIYTDKNARDLPPSTELRLRDAAKQLAQFVSQVQISHKYTQPSQHLYSLETLSWNRPESTERPLETWIQDLRKTGYIRVLDNDKTLNLKSRISDDIFNHFEKITGIRFSELSQNEQTEFKHYLCHAAGMGPLGCP